MPLQGGLSEGFSTSSMGFLISTKMKKKMIENYIGP